MNDSKAYAPLGMLRDAVRDQKVISFLAGGEHWTVEPHELGQAKRTGAIVIVGKVVKGPTTNTWLDFRYSDVRSLQIERESFERLRPPFSREAHKTPQARERAKRLAAARMFRASQP
jgi:hypothetical protein